MKRYDKYKDSGVEWIGKIPENWKVRRLGNLLTDYSEKNNSEFPLLSITREKGVILRDLEEDENHNFIPDDLSGYKKLYLNYFGMNKMKAWQGSYGISKYTGIVSPAYYTFKISDLLYPDFFHLAIRSKTYISFFGSASDGVRIGQWDLSKTRMKNIPFIIPSFPEQQAIASFLDDKTSKIDQTISIKEKEIELLKERRQILIQKAVTKGLDDKVKLKDSGVEWIGEVPEHWKVSFIKRFSYNITDGSHSSPETTHEGKNYVSVKDVNDSGEIDLVSCKKISNKDFKLLVRNGCQPKLNDLLLTKDGTIGRAAVVSENDFVILSSLGLITPNSKILNPYFLRYHFISPHTVENMYSLIAGSALTRLTIEKIKKIEIVVPSLNEQTQIVHYLEKIEEKISKAISLKEQEIEKLKEYKTVLIDNVVTGKVKVS
ncbi:TPA: restriction endonuclease subunit S [Elizabethkingia anophelis]|uniref:restriction endonuclease subunit S n=1 Tax=Elizabethkingia anophelis TaxID=1117645 RepID=UPI00136D92C3|nr:restriction endonuclease subunit S [Elizabethkingia anophelis]MYY24946.1 restriction endonuclease subunit S [Elizabethkingia anophelis]